jgi:hypothetical protein
MVRVFRFLVLQLAVLLLMIGGPEIYVMLMAMTGLAFLVAVVFQALAARWLPPLHVLAALVRAAPAALWRDIKSGRIAVPVPRALAADFAFLAIFSSRDTR